MSAIRTGVVGESISITSGAAFDRFLAATKAVAEAVERWSGEYRGQVPVETPKPSDEVLSREDLLASSGREPALWCRALGLVSRKPVFVPASTVFFPFYLPEEDRVVLPSTNGLAAGQTLMDAMLGGLLECIERDAWSIMLSRLEDGCAHEYGSVPSSAVASALGKWITDAGGAGVSTFSKNITTGLRVPTVLTTLYEERGIDGTPKAHLGCSAATDLELAAKASFLEAAQSRAVDLQGAREDLTPLPTTRDEAVDPWFITEQEDPSEPMASSSESLPRSAEETISCIVAQMTDVGLPEPLFVDLSNQDLSLHVVRVITPGLEVYAFDDSRRGTRMDGR